jgi:hypothetical protein
VATLSLSEASPMRDEREDDVAQSDGGRYAGHQPWHPYQADAPARTREIPRDNIC